MSRDDRNDTDLYLAIGGEVPFKAMRRAMRARWMKARGVSDERTTKRAPQWLTDHQRFWCEVFGIPAVDNQATFVKSRANLPNIPVDHPEVFTRDGRVVVYLAQLYFDDLAHAEKRVAAWREAAERLGLTFEYSLSDSWHYPGRTILLALWLPGEADRA